MNIDSKITKLLPVEINRFLQKTGETARKCGIKIYLVGGIVRDLLLGVTNTDIDILVEGDAIALARSLKPAGVKITPHPDFCTANMKWHKWSIDFAAARTEVYKEPGALPEISLSTVIPDLCRRDFSINAMALSLDAESYGELFDPYNGYDDLHKRQIKVLHDKSFADDATRIWRAIRYEQRLDFIIEPVTLRQIKRDIKYLDTISGERIRHELELVLKEKYPEKMLHRAESLGALSGIHPGLKIDDWMSERYEEARNMGLVDSSLLAVYLALLFYRLDSKEVENLSGRLHFARPLNKVLKETMEMKEKLSGLNNSNIKRSEIYFLLYSYTQLAIVANSLASESTVIERNIDIFLSRLQHIKPRLNGDDIKKMGIKEGPKIKEILHILHTARLDGKVTTKQGEIRLVYNWLDTQQNQNGAVSN